jgi:hypothetical protein
MVRLWRTGLGSDPHAVVGFLICLVTLAAVLLPFSRVAVTFEPPPLPIPDRGVPSTLGWRSWVWDEKDHALLSPTQQTPWLDPELRCETWDTSDAIRGVAGIHAHLVPIDWECVESEYSRTRWAMAPGQLPAPAPLVTGVVERFGRYVLGTEGWRAEWVVIRKLRAPTPEIAAALALVYPEVEITHGYRQDR